MCKWNLMCRIKPIFGIMAFIIRWRGLFIELPAYMCLCLSVWIKIAEGYSPYNRSLEFSEIKKLHNRGYGVVVNFAELRLYEIFSILVFC